MLTAVDFDRSGWRTPHPERWRAKVWPSPLADACIEVSQRSRALVACPILFVCSAMALVEPWPARRMRDPAIALVSATRDPAFSSERLDQRADTPFESLSARWIGGIGLSLAMLGAIALLLWGMVEYPSLAFDPTGEEAFEEDFPNWIPIASAGMIAAGSAGFFFSLWTAGRRNKGRA